MFRIKICGITCPDDALAARDAGADAIGLNFCPASPRFLTSDQAERIVDALGDHVTTVGVFVDMSSESVLATCEQFRLAAVQLHGDEPPEQMCNFTGRPLIKAFRCGPDGIARRVAKYVERCQQLGRLPDAILVDAWVPNQYGGTGRTPDWTLLAGNRPWLAGLPLVLAGGLTPDNVSQAIARVGPAAVDTASGVERAPGKKDTERMAAFVRAAQNAFEKRAGFE
jgi:phosphoribosylanthranilate isomerase